MLELPEVFSISGQLQTKIIGKTIKDVLPANKEHKFCWFNGDVKEYKSQILNSKITAVKGFGIFVQIEFDNGKMLCFNDGVNVRIKDTNDLPKSYQLVIILEDENALVFTVAMYGGIILHDGDYDNEYYLKSMSYISPLSDTFDKYFYEILDKADKKLSVKAFLATEQRFPGIGNGCLQDIIFEAKLHPKRKLNTISENEIKNLLKCIKKVITEMTQKGGRDTEKDIYGNTGNYTTKMSKNTVEKQCPNCKEKIIKETYLGGTVYYCPKCQQNINDKNK